MIKWSRKVKAKIVENGMTVDQFVGMMATPDGAPSRQWISMALNGRREPSLDETVRAAQLLDLTLEEMIDAGDPAPKEHGQPSMAPAVLGITQALAAELV